ncbi:MAG TPA: hypothetical protein VMS62_12295, partial [Gemmatimonadales bacterium]|nr:hypothetical protein [Gemmatimonadales bacterium]
MYRRGSQAAGPRGGLLGLLLSFRCVVAALLPRCPAAPLCALAMITVILPARASAQTDLEESRR